MNRDLPNLFAQESSQWAEYPFFMAEHVLVNLVVLTFFLLSLVITIGLILFIVTLCWWIKWLILEGPRRVIPYYPPEFLAQWTRRLVCRLCSISATTTEEKSTSNKGVNTREDTNTPPSQSIQTSSSLSLSPGTPNVATSARFTGIAASSYERVARRAQAPESPSILPVVNPGNIHIPGSNKDGILDSAHFASTHDDGEPTAFQIAHRSLPEPGHKCATETPTSPRAVVEAEASVEDRVNSLKRDAETVSSSEPTSFPTASLSPMAFKIMDDPIPNPESTQQVDPDNETVLLGTSTSRTTIKDDSRVSPSTSSLSSPAAISTHGTSATDGGSLSQATPSSSSSARILATSTPVAVSSTGTTIKGKGKGKEKESNPEPELPTITLSVSSVTDSSTPSLPPLLPMAGGSNIFSLSPTLATSTASPITTSESTSGTHRDDASTWGGAIEVANEKVTLNSSSSTDTASSSSSASETVTLSTEPRTTAMPCSSSATGRDVPNTFRFTSPPSPNAFHPLLEPAPPITGGFFAGIPCAPKTVDTPTGSPAFFFGQDNSTLASRINSNPMAYEPVTTGSSLTPYWPTYERDGKITLHYQPISCMIFYRGTSFEELRVQDYEQDRKSANLSSSGRTANSETSISSQNNPQQPIAQTNSLFGNGPQPANAGLEAFGHTDTGTTGTSGSMFSGGTNSGVDPGASARTRVRQQRTGFGVFGQPQPQHPPQTNSFKPPPMTGGLFGGIPYTPKATGTELFVSSDSVPSRTGSTPATNGSRLGEREKPGPSTQARRSGESALRSPISAGASSTSASGFVPGGSRSGVSPASATTVSASATSGSMSSSSSPLPTTATHARIGSSTEPARPNSMSRRRLSEVSMSTTSASAAIPTSANEMSGSASSTSTSSSPAPSSVTHAPSCTGSSTQTTRPNAQPQRQLGPVTDPSPIPAAELGETLAARTGGIQDSVQFNVNLAPAPELPSPTISRVARTTPSNSMAASSSLFDRPRVPSLFSPPSSSPITIAPTPTPPSSSIPSLTTIAAINTTATTTTPSAYVDQSPVISPAISATPLKYARTSPPNALSPVTAIQTTNAASAMKPSSTAPHSTNVTSTITSKF
ncbi:hypothetical protein PQX77_021293 [Marasmius sp. AFHP31]|nr:hypothetical protein PQX77_021293 [Marasmius sp. AFHP31]